VPGWLTVMVLMFVAEVIPVPDQLYVEEVVVVALAFMLIKEQLKVPELAGVTTGNTVFCVTATVLVIDGQPAAEPTTKL